MNNKEFGILIKVQRQNRHWSQKQLASKARLPRQMTDSLSVEVIDALENGQIPIGDLYLHLEPLAQAFELSEAQKEQLYGAAGFIYKPQKTSSTQQLVTWLLDHLPYPLAVYTPLVDLIAINSYFSELYGLDSKSVSVLRSGPIGANILRFYFDPFFGAKRIFGGEAGWRKHVHRMLLIFRTLSFSYVTSPRYHYLLTALQQSYPQFEELWQSSERTDDDDDLFQIQPLVTVHHPRVGAMTFLKLSMPQFYLGSDIHVYGHLPTLASETAYNEMRKGIEDTTTYYFDSPPVKDILPLLASVDEEDYDTAMKQEARNDKIALSFYDDNARESWEIHQDVDRISATIVQESSQLNLQPVTLSEENERRGLHALFAAGTVIGTAEENILLVPERSLLILERLGIAYRIVSVDK